MRRDDPSGGDFERGKQGRGAVPFVVVALAGQGAPVRQLQIALRPLQGLDRRLFVDTENNGLGGRIDIKADHIGGFRHELRVVALAPGLAGGKVDIVLAQEAPDILNINVAQGLGQQRTRPPPIALRRRLIQKRQNALAGGLAVDRLLARAGTVLEPIKAVVGKARRQLLTMRGWTPTSSAIERVLRPSAASKTIRARFTSRCAVVGARQRASSTLRTFGLSRTSLALGIIQSLNHDSPTKKSGY